MDRQRVVRKLVAAAVMAAFGASGTALAAEVEPNYPAAQRLTITGNPGDVKGGATVSGSIDHVEGRTPDVDFYSFVGKKGDTVIFDIDGTEYLDAFVTVFGPGMSAVGENDDMGGIGYDPGSNQGVDPYFELELPEDGTYTVAVSESGVSFSDTGTLETTAPQSAGGPYTLVISGVTIPQSGGGGTPPQGGGGDTPPQSGGGSNTPPSETPGSGVASVNIKIRHGLAGRTHNNHRKHGTIPVLVMSSPEVHANNIDMKSITFGVTGDEPSLKSCHKTHFDRNRDGRPDFLCFFDNQMANFRPGDLQGHLKGETKQGARFKGTGALRATVVKRDHRDRDDDDGDRRKRRNRGGRD